MNIKKDIRKELKTRVLVMDGAMGSLIQDYKLTAADYHGQRLKDFPFDQKGNNDILSITHPEIIREIHGKYLEAGADIVETNTFNSQAISLADYHMETLGYELSKAGAECAKRAVLKVQAAQPGRQCFVAGAIGPTNRTASLSPDVNDPGARGVTFAELQDAYHEQALALHRQLGDRLGEANVLQAIGDVQNFRKDMDTTLASYAEALTLYRAVGAIGLADGGHDRPERAEVPLVHQPTVPRHQRHTAGQNRSGCATVELPMVQGDRAFK